MNKQAINGVLLLNKATGISSNQALQQVKRLFNAAKAGHTGCLDPLASGVLPICFGEATKFSQYSLNANKSYIATIKLGITTTTGDSEGEVLTTAPVPELTSEYLQTVMQTFIGKNGQVPPMYSALKHQGQPLYKLARQGIKIEIKSREIEIYTFELLNFNLDTIECNVQCSKGTYIRTLAEDLGAKLGCGAHIIGLQRTSSGKFKLNNSYSYQDLLQHKDLTKILLPVAIMLDDLPKCELSDLQVTQLWQGKIVNLADSGMSPGLYKVFAANDRLIGTATINDGQLKAQRLMSFLTTDNLCSN